uniref:hypothetical protein n=1 Tax=Eisenbergiella sp. TaxID=1924109 RepID=UPI003AB3DCE5
HYTIEYHKIPVNKTKDLTKKYRLLKAYRGIFFDGAVKVPTSKIKIYELLRKKFLIKKAIRESILRFPAKYYMINLYYCCFM